MKKTQLRNSENTRGAERKLASEKSSIHDDGYIVRHEGHRIRIRGKIVPVVLGVYLN